MLSTLLALACCCWTSLLLPALWSYKEPWSKLCFCKPFLPRDFPFRIRERLLMIQALLQHFVLWLVFRMCAMLACCVLIFEG